MTKMERLKTTHLALQRGAKGLNIKTSLVHFCCCNSLNAPASIAGPPGDPLGLLPCSSLKDWASWDPLGFLPLVHLHYTISSAARHECSNPQGWASWGSLGCLQCSSLKDWASWVPLGSTTPNPLFSFLLPSYFDPHLHPCHHII